MKRNAMRLTAIGLVFCFTSLAHGAEVAPNDVSFDDGAVAQSLTGVAGNATDGREWFVNRKLGNCLGCHANSETKEHPFHGEVGPPLDGVADRWSESELRGIVSNSKEMFDGTIMPAFYNTSNQNRPLEDFAGKTILSAQQVEDIVAYLMTLKE